MRSAARPGRSGAGRPPSLQCGGAGSGGVPGAPTEEMDASKSVGTSTAACEGLPAVAHACFRQTARWRSSDAMAEVTAARSLASRVTRRSRSFAQQKRDTHTPHWTAAFHLRSSSSLLSRGHCRWGVGRSRSGEGVGGWKSVVGLWHRSAIPGQARKWVGGSGPARKSCPATTLQQELTAQWAVTRYNQRARGSSDARSGGRVAPRSILPLASPCPYGHAGLRARGVQGLAQFSTWTPIPAGAFVRLSGRPCSARTGRDPERRSGRLRGRTLIRAEEALDRLGR